MNIKKTLLTIAVVITSQVLWAQDDPLKVNVIPPSPDAAALGSYGNVPVSLYNGRPNISVPLYAIQGKNIQLPISLSYSSGGIKVKDVSSWVGLGWTLNAGGVITRSVNGLADEGPGGEIRSLYSEYDNMLKYRNGPPLCNSTDPTRFSTLVEYYNYQKSILDPQNFYIETQPDNYFYNFGAYSGKMLIDGDFNAFEAPYEGFQIQMSIVSQTYKEITSWEITTPDGTTYVFSHIDKTTLEGQSPQNYIFNSSWYLTRIESFDGNEVIEFDYTSKAYYAEFDVALSTTRRRVLASNSNNQCFATGNYGPISDGMATYISEKVLQSIIYKRNGQLVNTVLFNSVDDRLDKVHMQGSTKVYGSRLNEIVILDSNGDKLKSFDLTQSYFGNYQDPNAPESSLRLKLESVQELGWFGSQSTPGSKPPHKFDYFDVPLLPDRLSSTAIDHWGYYNGKDGNTGLIPTIRNMSDHSENDYPGADRSPSALHTQAHSLNAITYPTGGKTVFTFEANQSPTNPYDEGPIDAVIPVSIPTGGEGANPPNPYYDDDIGVIDPFYTVVQVDLPANATDIKLKATATANGCGGAGAPCQTFEELLRAWIFTGTEPIPPDFYVNGSNRITLDYSGFESLINSTVNTVDLTSLVNPAAGESFTIVIMNSMPEVSTQIAFEYLYSALPQDQYMAGGLRIKQIKDYDENGSVVSTKAYDYILEDGTTSGRLFSAPTYHHVTYSFRKDDLDQHGCNRISCAILESQASSASSLSSIMGSHVGYSRVVETSVDLATQATNGKTVYTYKNDNVPGGTPYAPVSNHDDYNGKLLGQMVYAGNGNILKEISNKYSWDGTGNNNPKSIWEVPYVSGVKVSPDYPTVAGLLCFYTGQNGCEAVKEYPTLNSAGIPCDPIGVCNEVMVFPNYFKDAKYSIYSRWVYLTEATTKDFHPADNTKWVETKTNYYYDDSRHAQISRETTLNSKGETIEIQRFYPLDYLTDPGDPNDPGASDFTTGHKLDPVIESISKVNGDVVNAVGYKYGAGILEDVYVYEIDAPIQNFQKSSDGKAFDNHEMRLSYTYDQQRNITSHTKDNGVTTVYIWGYNNTLPVARIVNSTYAEVATALGPDLTLINGSFSESTIRDRLNVLRDHASMSNAEITSYTYKPGIGISSVTDPNSLVTEYIYDEHGRLQSTRDHEGNILTKYDYHYGQGD